MALRDAALRLTLKPGSFLGGLDEISRKAKAVARQMEDSIGSSLKTGFQRGVSGIKSSLSGVGASLKSTFLQAGGQGAAAFKQGFQGGGSGVWDKLKGGFIETLGQGAAFNLGGAINDAQDLNDVYKNIAFSIRAGTGEAISYQTVQSKVEATAARWKRANREVAETFKAIYDDTGSVEFATQAMQTVSKTATATGASHSALANIVGQLNEKFGIMGPELDDAMAALIAMGNKGGAGVEDLGAKIGLIGASAKLAGLEGKEGLMKVLAMMNLADGATGNFKKSMASVQGVLEQLADPDRLKAIEKALGTRLRGNDGRIKGDPIEAILKKTRGQSTQLAKAFTGESLKLLVEYGKIYEQAFAGTEGTVKQKTAAALDAYRAALTEASKQTLSAADLEQQATERLEDPKRRLQDIMNTLTTAFSQPAMLDALDEVGKQMPALARTLARFLSFVARHPLLAAGGFIAGKAAVEAAGGAGTSLAQQAASGMGKSIAESFTTAVATSGKWAVAGQALGVAAAALIAFKVGQHFVDQDLDKHFGGAASLADARTTAEVAAREGTTAEKIDAAEALRAQIAKERKNGPGWIAQAASVGANIYDSNVKTADDMHATGIAKAEFQLKELEASIAKGVGANEKQVAALDRHSRSLDRNTSALEGKGGNGRNGLPPPAPTRPGHGGANG